jgi:hypothetical protein
MLRQLFFCPIKTPDDFICVKIDYNTVDRQRMPLKH